MVTLSKRFKQDPSLMKGRIKIYEKELVQLFEDARPELVAIADMGHSLEAHELAPDFSFILLHLNKILQQRILDRAERLAKKQAEESYKSGMLRADVFLGVEPDKYIAKLPRDTSAIDALRARNLSGLKGITEEMSKNIVQILTDGMLKGENPKTVAKTISESVDSIGINRARNIARTETMKAFNTGATNRYKQRGIEEVEWCSSVGSSRTCNDCEELDGKRYPIDDAPDCPHHPGCRCCLLPVIPKLG